MKTSLTEKNYQSQLNQVEADIISINSIISEKQRELRLKRQISNDIRNKMASLNSHKQGLTLSEHALLRYFERVKGFDLKEVEKEILNDKVKVMIETLGETGTYPFSDSHQIVLKKGTVVTIQ